MKDGEAGAKLACKLERIDLEKDVDGDPQSSCVIVATETPDTEPKLAKGAQSALDLLKDLIARDGVRLSAGEPGVPPGTRAVLQKTWRETFIKKHPAEEYEARKRAFNRATGELQKRDLVDFYDEFAWLL